MLMSRSQLHPVMIAAAAGGKMMATTMRMISELWTMLDEADVQDVEDE